MQLRIVPLSGMGGPYAIKDEDGPPGYTAQWIRDKELAQMFAAAPDLLETCKAVIRYVDDHDAVVGAWGDIYDKLQKAVAKAEGRNEK